MQFSGMGTKGLPVVRRVGMQLLNQGDEDQKFYGMGKSRVARMISETSRTLKLALPR